MFGSVRVKDNTNSSNKTCYLLVAEIGEEGTFDRNGAIQYYSYEGFPFTRVIGVVPKDYDLERLARCIHRKIYNQQYAGLMEYNTRIAKAHQNGKEKDAAEYRQCRDEVLAHMLDCVVYDHKLKRRPNSIPKNLVSEWVVRHPYATTIPWEDTYYRFFLLSVLEIEITDDDQYFEANDVYHFDFESYMPRKEEG